MTDSNRFSLVKPTLDTPFHIDFDWWKQHDNNWRVHLISCLCQAHQTDFAEAPQHESIDWIDPNTGEVSAIDGLQHVLMTHCSKQPDFITPHMTLVDAVFRVFLANGNNPMSANELSKQTEKPANTILKTISGPKIYKGLRPRQS